MLFWVVYLLSIGKILEIFSVSIQLKPWRVLFKENKPTLKKGTYENMQQWKWKYNENENILDVIEK